MWLRDLMSRPPACGTVVLETFEPMNSETTVAGFELIFQVWQPHPKECDLGNRDTSQILWQGK